MTVWRYHALYDAMDDGANFYAKYSAPVDYRDNMHFLNHTLCLSSVCNKRGIRTSELA